MENTDLVARLYRHHDDFGEGRSQNLCLISHDCKMAADRIVSLEDQLRTASSSALRQARMSGAVHALKRLQVNTGSLACLGCGYEHQCSTRGCAIIREAVDLLDVSKSDT